MTPGPLLTVLALVAVAVLVTLVQADRRDGAGPGGACSGAAAALVGVALLLSPPSASATPPAHGVPSMPGVEAGGLRHQVDAAVARHAAEPGSPLDLSATRIPVERIADEFGRDLAWLATGTSADLLSTSAALRWCATCREGNPLGWDVEARVALKLGTGTAAATTCWWARRAGHPRLAGIVRWAVFGVQALAAASNTLHAFRGR